MFKKQPGRLTISDYPEATSERLKMIYKRPGSRRQATPSGLRGFQRRDAPSRGGKSHPRYLLNIHLCVERGMKWTTREADDCWTEDSGKAKCPPWEDRLNPGARAGLFNSR